MTSCLALLWLGYLTWSLWTQAYSSVACRSSNHPFLTMDFNLKNLEHPTNWERRLYNVTCHIFFKVTAMKGNRIHRQNHLFLKQVSPCDFTSARTGAALASGAQAFAGRALLLVFPWSFSSVRTWSSSRVLPCPRCMYSPWASSHNREDWSVFKLACWFLLPTHLCGPHFNKLLTVFIQKSFLFKLYCV